MKVPIWMTDAENGFGSPDDNETCGVCLRPGSWMSCYRCLERLDDRCRDERLRPQRTPATKKKNKKGRAHQKARASPSGPSSKRSGQGRRWWWGRTAAGSSEPGNTVEASEV